LEDTQNRTLNADATRGPMELDC